jgi:hypothetical protein
MSVSDKKKRELVAFEADQAGHEVPALLLEKAALGELSAAEKAQLEARLDGRDLEALVAPLRAENERILSRYPSKPQVEQIEARVRNATAAAGKKSKRNLKLVFAAVPVLAAALTLAFVWPFFEKDAVSPPVNGENSGIRLKGKPELKIYRKAAAKPVKLESGALVENGVTLQIAIKPASATHVLIISVDGRGAATLHFPSDEHRSTSLRQGKTSFLRTRDYGWTLSRAYQLDDAPSYERFFFVVSDKAIDVAGVQAAVEKLRSSDERPALPAGCKLVDEVVLRKPTSKGAGQ